MNDLFNPEPTLPSDAYEIWLHNEIKRRNAEEAAERKRLGIIPPWVETDGLLEADEFKLLTLIADNAGRVYYGGEDRKRLADMMGFKAIGNLEAVVKKCLAKELISITTEQHMRDDWSFRADRQRVNATEYGMSMLEETEHEKEAEREAEAVPDLGRVSWR